VAAVGLYAVVAYGVARRTGEIGVRVALGATAGNIRQLVLGEGARHAVLGCAVGIAAGMAATHALRAKLYGVKPLDVPTFVVVTVVLLATAMLASWLPARRAAAIPPTEALRSE
jgi:ABC-type lipoprotein release transport system permease subunit